MSRTVTILSLVLVAQLALAAVVWLAPAGGGRGGAAAAIDVEPQAVRTVAITDADGETLELERGEDGWKLPASDGYPARAARVRALLDDVVGIGGGIPVARSAEARERLRVADDAFERRLALRGADGELATVLLGSSAGAGRVYARLAGTGAVHEARVEIWRASADPSDWYDGSHAAVDPGSVQRAELPGFTLERGDDGWRLAGEADSEGPIDADEAASLIARLARPEFDAVARGEPPGGEPALVYRLVPADGEPVRYRYYPGGEASPAPVMVRDDQPWRYRVPGDRLDSLREISLASLRPGAEAESAAEQDEQAPGAS